MLSWLNQAEGAMSTEQAAENVYDLAQTEKRLGRGDNGETLSCFLA
jgi:hypothetical protein